MEPREPQTPPISPSTGAPSPAPPPGPAGNVYGPGASAHTHVPPTSTVVAPKADLAKRLIAALIDGVLASVVGVIPVIGALVGAAYMLVRDGLELDFMHGRSIGKHLMKLRPIRLDGQPMDIMTSVKRNIPFAIGPAIMIIPILGWIIGPVIALIIGVIEIVLVLTDRDGRRLGDKFAETKVIEVAE
jgi:uncharacterized RDD family membrane protein YckC